VEGVREQLGGHLAASQRQLTTQLLQRRTRYNFVEKLTNGDDDEINT